MRMPDTANDYAGEYSEARFWTKLARFAKVAGAEVVEKSLWLFYAAQRADTPKWAKGIIYGALGYFILPLDAIPDFTPAVGYADDLGALAVALAIVASCIDDEVKRLARQKLADWFGNPDSDGAAQEAGKEPSPQN
jgi:uncharacterized membrane protein YkvA (DUF1232 family)